MREPEEIERDRAGRLAELESDNTDDPGWRERFAPGTFGCHEALHLVPGDRQGPSGSVACGRHVGRGGARAVRSSQTKARCSIASEGSGAGGEAGGDQGP